MLKTWPPSLHSGLARARRHPFLPPTVEILPGELIALSITFYSPDRRRGNLKPVGQHSNRDALPPRLEDISKNEKGTIMKKFGFASVVATGFIAAIIGLAAPAQADLGHHDWVNQINGGSSVVVPQVDTNVHN
jgi:hypothetical protein